MTAAIDITGQRFGKLVAVERVGTAKSKSAVWLFKCDCGGETRAPTNEVRSGRRKACSCGLRIPKHGMSGTRLYGIWEGMKARCANDKKFAYQHYGGRGISVCAEWQTFIPFMGWALANGYSDKLEIDRINNDGNYEPGNCRWVTRSENMYNRRPSKPLGLRYTVIEIKAALDALGISHEEFFSRLPRKRIYR